LDSSELLLSNQEWAELQLVELMKESELSREQALEVAKAEAPTLYKMLFS
jgi:hypothetical protein